jgi:hypothetical protein
MTPEAVGAALRAHAESVVGQPFVWGVNDCTTWAAAWIEKLTNRPISIPKYTTEQEAAQIISDAGSLENLWSNYLSKAGVRETYTPQLGNIAVIDHKIGPIGAIIVHGGFAAVRVQGANSSGVTLLRPRQILRSWGV